MTCQEFWSRMPELESTAIEWEHARECASCSELLEQQRELAAGLRRIAGSRHHGGAPPHVETALLAAFRDRTIVAGTAPLPAAGAHRMRAFWMPLAAALVTLAVLAGLNLRTRPRLDSVAINPAGAAMFEETELEPGFISLPTAAEMIPGQESDLVHVLVSRKALVALGVPVAEGELDEPVEAEVLLGAGGMPQAVRVIE